jgi:hypothetical protein
MIVFFAMEDSMRLGLALLIVCLCGPAFAQGTTISDIQQIGDNNAVIVEQAGTDFMATSEVRMAGDRNEARVNQHGEHAIATSQINLTSSFVAVGIEQRGDGGELNAQASFTGNHGGIFITQDGVDLRAYSSASITGQSSDIFNRQDGEHGESVSIAQITGLNNYASIDQRAAAGASNTSTVVISGEGNATTVSQFRGDALVSDVTQSGHGNTVANIQFGNDDDRAESTIRQNGDGNLALITQANSGPHAVSDLTMNGNSNRAEVLQESDGPSNFLMADLAGDANSLKMQQTGFGAINEERVTVTGSDNAVAVEPVRVPYLPAEPLVGRNAVASIAFQVSATSWPCPSMPSALAGAALLSAILTQFLVCCVSEKEAQHLPRRIWPWRIGVGLRRHCPTPGMGGIFDQPVFCRGISVLSGPMPSGSVRFAKAARR